MGRNRNTVFDRAHEPSSHQPAVRGSALVLALILVAGLITLGLAAVTIGTTESSSAGANADQVQAECLAEAAVREAVLAVAAGRSGRVGSRQAPALLGNGIFWVVATDLGNERRLLEVRAMKGSGRAALEVLIGTKDVTVPAGAFGDRSLVIDSNGFIDSYKSAEGSYASQATEKRKAHRFSTAGGVAGSNADVTIDNNGQVFGDVQPGPGGVVSINGNAYVAGKTTAAEKKIAIPPVEVPKIAVSGDLKLNKGKRKLPPGQYGFKTLELDSNSSLEVVGPATIVVEEFHVNSNSSLVADTTNGPVKIYTTGQFTMDSNTLVAPANRKPKDLNVFITAVGKTAELKSNDQFVGTMFAPNSPVLINSNSSIYGSVIAQDLLLDSNAAVHIDVSLNDSEDKDRVPDILSWTKAAMPSDLTRDGRDPLLVLDLSRSLLLTPEQSWGTEAEPIASEQSPEYPTPTEPDPVDPVDPVPTEPTTKTNNKKK